jgi:hypothetical protein
MSQSLASLSTPLSVGQDSAAEVDIDTAIQGDPVGFEAAYDRVTEGGFGDDPGHLQRVFIQLAGAGHDSRRIERVAVVELATGHVSLPFDPVSESTSHDMLSARVRERDDLSSSLKRPSPRARPMPLASTLLVAECMIRGQSAR